MIGWRLDGADLTNADLSGADASLATFHNTILAGVRFDGAKIPWCSHDVTSEIFRQAAGDDPEKLEVAKINIGNREWTYQDFAQLGHPQFEWAMSVLRSVVRSTDATMPAQARAYLVAPTKEPKCD